MNEALIELQKEWSFDIQLRTERREWPYNFLLDPESFSISVKPLVNVSSDPSDYERRVEKTSEVLPFMLAVRLVNIFQLDLRLVKYPPMAKLLMCVLDGNAPQYSAIRVNVEDIEEWDYFDPNTDELFTSALKSSGFMLGSTRPTM